MSVTKKYIILFILLFLTSSAQAQSTHVRHYLTPSQIERLKAVKEELSGVDTEPLEDTIHQLEKSRHPLMGLEMKEAMAKAYTDIASNFNIQDQQKKTWLYSMVCLNMAYLQFGGSEGNYGSTTELNRLIRKTLIKDLPPDVLKTSGSLYSLE